MAHKGYSNLNLLRKVFETAPKDKLASRVYGKMRKKKYLGDLFINGEDSTISDKTGKHNILTNGNTVISTAQKKYNNSSIYFDGDNDSLSANNDADFDLVGSDFTIDLWVYLKNNNVDYSFINAFNTEGWNFGFNGSGSGFGLFFNRKNDTVIKEAAAENLNWNIKQWYHIAIVKESDNWLLFKDGTIIKNITDAIDTTTPNNNLLIGLNNSNLEDFDGYMDNIRITKGEAHWTENFDVNNILY